MTPTSEGLRQAAEAAVDLFSGAPQFEVAQENEVAFRCIYPIAAHGIEQVRCALVLIDQELSYPAEVNARVALQHAVTAQWLLLCITEQSEQGLVDELKRNRSATLNDMRVGTALPQELLAEINTGPAGGGPARRFWLMCERFSPDKTLYVLYRLMSDAVHPSIRTLANHLQADEARGVYGLRRDGPPEPELDLLMTLAVSAMLSLSAVEYLRLDQSRMADVVAIAREWNVPLDLANDDNHPGLRRPNLQVFNESP